jgi:hypothetical protein
LRYRSIYDLLIIKSKISTLSLIVLLLSVLLLGLDPTLQTYAQGQLSNQFPQSIIAFSSTDQTPHSLELKFIQQHQDSEPQEISGFSLNITNTLTAHINSQANGAWSATNPDYIWAGWRQR